MLKKSDLIISNILCNKIKKSFIVNLIKYNSNATTIAQYFIKQIIFNIIVVIAVRVALLFLFSLAIYSFFKLLL